MTKLVKVKKHVRDGVVIDAHDREVCEGEQENLTKKVKILAETKQKRQKLQSLLFGSK